jgi:PAS domain S-box-containing protein
MASVEEFPAARRLTEYEALLAAGPDALDAIASAVYLCDPDGQLVGFNAEAVRLWGREPRRGEDRFCGSHRLFWPDGAPLAHDACPMADALRHGTATHNAEVVIERPDGARVTALVNIRPLRDHRGRIQGAINCFQDITARKAAEADARRAAEDLEDFFENSAVGLHIVSSAGIILRANKAELDLLGYTAAEYVGRHIAEFHADTRSIGDILQRLSCGEKLDRYPARLRAKDGRIKHVLITSNSRFHDGRFVSTRCFTTDVSDLHAAQRRQQASEQRLAASDEQLRLRERHLRDVLEALPAAVYTTDADGRITFYNRAAVEMAGRTPEPGDAWCVTWRLYRTDGTPLSHDECPMAIALRERRIVRGEEAVAERPDGTRVPFIPYPTPLFDEGGRLVGAVNMLVDITDRKQAETRQKTLIDELNHRVKNTLATVQSLASQTARHAPSLDAFIDNFDARILALARAHDLLSKRYWQNASLAELAGEILAPFTGASSERVHIDGPLVMLEPRTALCLTMVLNELATNALKYGAWSSIVGTIDVTWREREVVGGAQLLVTWREQGGRPVTPPARRGFGTRLMDRCIERDLGGKIKLEFATAGVTCRLTIPRPRGP